MTDDYNDDPHARMIDLICDLAVNDGEGPWDEFVQRARDILNVMEADDVRAKWRAEPLPGLGKAVEQIVDSMAESMGLAPEAFRALGKLEAEAGIGTQREFNVMLRRPCWQYAHESIMAASAADAVEKMREAVENGRLPKSLDWDTDDRTDPVDWISAEADIPLGERTDGSAVDCAEWEPHKLSPAPLVEGLNRIRTLAGTPANEVAMGSALATIIEIATEALNKAILGG